MILLLGCLWLAYHLLSFVGDLLGYNQRDTDVYERWVDVQLNRAYKYR